MNEPMSFYDRWGREYHPAPGEKIHDRHGVYVFLVAKGHTLLSWQNYAPDLAELLGGKIDEGESIGDALRREVLEESGLVLSDAPPQNEYRRKNGFYHIQGTPPCYSIHHQIYWVMDYEGTLPDPIGTAFTGPEGNRLQWVPLEQLGSIRITYPHAQALRVIAPEYLP